MSRARSTLRRHVAAIVAVWSMVGTPAALLGADAADLVKRGNQALEAGRYDKAIANYQRAATASPERFEPIYNEAIAHYRQGNIARARELFERATAATDPELRANAHYNLGNCDFNEALQPAAGDAQAGNAIDKLNRAIAHYRNALATNPDDSDARANIELAGKLRSQLQQQSKQQRPQSGGDQGQQDQDQQPQEDQSQSGPQSNQDSQDRPPPEQPRQNNNDQPDDQQRPENPANNGQPENPPADDQEQPNRAENNQANNGDQDAGDENRSNRLPSPSGDQPANEPKDKPSDQQPAEEPVPPKPTDQPQPSTPDQQQPTRGGPQSGGSSSSAASQSPPSETNSVPPGAMQPLTSDEAEKMLQAIRDRDLQRRRNKPKREPDLPAQVDRDW